jgi:serine/threonine protein kinase
MTNESPSPVTVAACMACGRALPRNAPGGVCPACLMQEGMNLVISPRAKPGEFVPSTAEEMALLFPDFEILAFIGQGGMGAVYKAAQPELDRTVAIKVLPPETAADPEFTERFRREAATLARLDHPNIVKLFDYGQREGCAYFVMEFVDGVDLSQRIAKGPLPLNEAFAITSQLCDALQHSHERGVVHRDIKPGNILLAPDGRVKVADFGLARLVHPDAADHRLTRTRATLGTPRYMAPEQMTPASDIDHRADIYAVGVVLYEMLTGSIPAGRFDPPSEKVTLLNPRIDEVVLRALSAEPERRHATATEVKNSFREAIEKPLPTRQERARTLALRAFMVSLVAAAVGVSGALLWSLRDRAKTGDSHSASGITPTAAQSSSSWLVVLNGDSTSVPAAEKAVAIAIAAARDEFGLLLKPDGTVLAWGSNRFGQTNVPAGLASVIAIATGQGPRNAHALALRSDGTVAGWGDNTFRQARPPAELNRAAAIAAGELHSLALTQDGRVVTWGNPASDALLVPPGLPRVQAIAAGADFSIALLQDGRIMAWGANDAGQCAVPKFEGRAVEIASGVRHSLARLENGRVVAWGDNRKGQCDLPAQIPPVTAIFAGADASAAIDAAGKIHTWGEVPEKFQPFTGSLRKLAIGSTTWAALVEGDVPQLR